jgi:hypothetical protein
VNNGNSIERGLGPVPLDLPRILRPEQALDVSDDGQAEKDALSGVLYGVTSKYDVPLMVTRGYPSYSFLAQAAESIKEQGKPAYLYYFGDYDPSGVDISRMHNQHIDPGVLQKTELVEQQEREPLSAMIAGLSG